MKVALLTYFNTLSYGATLQTYAMIKALEGLGHDVTLINLNIPNPYGRIKAVLLFPKWVKTWFFKNKYFKNVTRKYNNPEALRKDPPEADLYMIGSDQTWNLDISQDKAPSFFLDFVGEDSKKVAYAASFGKEKIVGTMWISRNKVFELLRRFKQIGIRENSGKDILQKEGINSTQVVDPVLLFDNYEELVGKITNRKEIALFKVDNSSEFYKKVFEVGKLASIPLCSVGSLRRIKGIKCPYPYGIKGWMRRLVSAEYVITDSFHGLVISLLYHKQFVIIPGDPKRATRLQSLLSLVGLDDRMMSVESSAAEIYAKLSTAICYENVDEKLKKEREKSLNFLKSIL